MDKGLQLPPALKPPETWLVSAELRQGRCLGYSPPLWPHQELPGMGVILLTPSPGLWRRACPSPAKGSL